MKTIINTLKKPFVWYITKQAEAYEKMFRDCPNMPWWM